jgi:DNA uptake protein ComE-like DNA-binding protein
VPRRLPQPGLTGADAEQAVLEAFVPGEAPIAVGELATRLEGKVSKPMVVQKLQRLRIAGKIVKHGGYNDATWALAPKTSAVQTAPAAVTAVAAPTTEPATEQSPATEPALHLVLTQMVRAARALTDDSLSRALQLPVSLPVAQQLQAAASALHQVSEALLTSDPA